MKNKRWIAAFFACLAITTFANISSATAQTRVAIVDIGLIFKNHPAFSQKLAALKQEADQFQNNALQEQQQLVQQAEILKQYTPGSPEYKSAESKLAQQSAAMEVGQRNKMRELMQQEAQLHYNTYTEINQLVSAYCEGKGIQLVLRYNSQKMDPQVPATVMQKVNGSVIYHNQNNDITQPIIARIAQLNGTAGAPVAPQR